MGILVLFLILQRKISAFDHYHFSCGFVIYGLIMLKYIPSISILLNVLIVNGWQSLPDSFSLSIEMIIFILHFINVTCHVDWPVDETSLHLWMNPISLWYRILLICCWIQFSNIFWGFLHVCSRISARYFFFFFFDDDVFVGFDIWVILAL